MTRQEPTLVLGSTGKTGRRVFERLAARGVATRVGARSGEPPFDWDDRDTWAPVLEGVGSVYVQHYLDALPGAAEILGSFAELAVANGVSRLVHLSGRGEAEAERAEQAVQDTGAEVTTLRSTWFSQNFSESYFLDGLLAGELALPAANTPEPFVDADDIADVAVAALTDDSHVGEVYELTGPRLLTFQTRSGRSRRRRAGRSATCPCRWRTSRPGWTSRGFRANGSSCSSTSSRRCSTGATPTWRTACSGRSDGSRGTSPTTRATSPPPASGHRPSPGRSEAGRARARRGYARPQHPAQAGLPLARRGGATSRRARPARTVVNRRDAALERASCSHVPLVVSDADADPRQAEQSLREQFEVSDHLIRFGDLRIPAVDVPQVRLVRVKPLVADAVLRKDRAKAEGEGIDCGCADATGRRAARDDDGVTLLRSQQ